jgi:hypothetical protein
MEVGESMGQPPQLACVVAIRAHADREDCFGLNNGFVLLKDTRYSPESR